MPKILRIENIESNNNKVTELNSSVTNTQYPSAKAVYDALQNIEGGGPTSIEVDQVYNPESENAQSGKAVAEAVANASVGQFKYYENLLDELVLEKGYITPNGSISGNATDNNWRYTPDYYEVKQGTTFVYKVATYNAVSAITFYGANKDLLAEYTQLVNNIETSYTVPEGSGIKYARFSCRYVDAETFASQYIRGTIIGGARVEVDETYNPESTNAQSGKAVAEAISKIETPEIDTSDLVGQKTPEGGEIFNDYERNKALGEGTTARGINTTAGTKAFKIISINEPQSDEGSPIDISSFRCSPDTGVKSGDVLELTEMFSYSIPSLDDIEVYVTNLYFNEFVLHNPTGFSSGKEAIAYVNNLGFFEGNKYKIVFTVDEALSEGFPVSATPVYDKSGYDITVHASVLEGATPYAIGDLLQIEGQNHQNNSYTIEAISEDGTVITAVKVDDRMAEAPTYNSKEDPDNSAENPTFNNPENWLYVAGKNEVTNGRISPQFVGAYAGGVNSVSSSWASFAYGRDVKATGNYAFAVGRNTLAAYGGAAFGRNSEAGISSIASGGGKATGTGCVALGISNTADFYGSVALGYETKSHAKGSVALGYGVITSSQNKEPSTGYNGEGQVILGRFNAINPRIAFAVGNGTSDSNRSNIFEVRKDGKAYTLDKKLVTEDELTTGLNTKPGTLYNGNYVFGNSTSKITGSGNVVFGTNNTVCNGVQKTFIAGDSNKVNANFASSLGVRNTISDYASMAFGDNLTTSNFRQIVVGWSNDTAGTYDARFVVGNGDSDKKSTAFMVMQDGSAWVKESGESEHSVVNNSKLQQKCDELLASIKDVGLELKDKTTNKDYRISIDNGEIKLEVVE